MDANAILQLGAQLFKGQLDTNHDGKMNVNEIGSALSSLLAGSQAGAGQAAGGVAGLASMIGNAQKSGNADLMSMASSWLSAGPNAPASNGALTQLLGQDKIAGFAKQLGLSPEQALKGLKAAVPDMVDKASPGGIIDVNSLLKSVGGVSGALNLAGKLFGK
jgi:uncharacterized protein YidB (DUF937 family)